MDSLTLEWERSFLGRVYTGNEEVYTGNEEVYTGNEERKMMPTENTKLQRPLSGVFHHDGKLSPV
jgi:hypothetical protein